MIFFNRTHLSLGFSSELLKHIIEGEVVHWCGRRAELNGGVSVRRLLQPPFQCLYLLQMRKGKQKGPVSSWLLAMAGTDRLGDDALRIFKIAP